MSLESRKGTALSDPGAELVDRVTALWERYARIILGALAALIVVAAVAYFTIRSNETQETAASTKLAQANTLFWQGDYERSKTIADEVAKQYGSTPSGLDALRIAGDADYWNGDFKAAVTSYRAYLAKHDSGLMGNVVRRNLAYALENDKQYAEASKLYDGLVGVFDRESSAEFLAGAARCQEALGNKTAAIEQLKRLVDEFGETSSASLARVRLAELEGLTHS